MNNVIIFADGGSRGNPGPAACGYVIYTPDVNVHPSTDALLYALSSTPIHSGGDYLGVTTNNVAEWQGVIKALEWVKKNMEDVNQLFIFLDSQLVVKQITGEYKVKQPHLKPLKQQVDQLLKVCEYYEVQHVYRKDNALADEQVNIVLDNQ